MKLFYFTASNSAAQKHLEDTIENDFPLENYFHLIDDEALKELGYSKKIKMWGATPGSSNISNWERLDKGDRFLIYGSNQNFIKYGKVTGKIQNRELAEEAWGTNSNGETWEYIFLVEILKDVDIDLSTFNEAVDYSPNFTPQGFSYISNTKLNNLLSKFNSIDDAITAMDNSIAKDDELEEVEEIEDYKNYINKIHKYILSKGYIYSYEEIANFYLSLKTKSFVILSGISGTGKSKLVRIFAEAVGATTKNNRFKMVSVKPNWNDAAELIGYKNIKDEFIPGELTEVIVEAINNKDKPYFVCLDEMNLARIEYYFSDYLSLIESKRREEGQIKTDQLINNLTESEYEDLYIPENLYVIGTVNMDDTTFGFSNKVLDRTNSIEFTDVNLSRLDFIKEGVEVETAANQFLKQSFLTIQDALKEDKGYVKEINQKVEEINQILKKYNYHFAYRTRDEIVFYMLENHKMSLLNEELAFDYQICQKILPKIIGSDLNIKAALIDLYNYCNEVEIMDRPDYLKDAEKQLEYATYQKSVEKIIAMLRGYENGFTSYWV
ncbi:AAA family ATPase [Natroniella sulfidigena]|uniref:McrB family protein n=1 Tax=Natroniella sulfidigena TaxID=723921 RepID=UPI00200B2E9E|nr:AAA family ATPase [Natroniella sulfidigena]MCK8817595.1 AAA family ATPase [Natroniella sulfidigena]